MQIIYDESKRAQNIVKHGLDFSDLTGAFFESAIVLPARQRRFMAINVWRNTVLAVVFARLGSEGISIISMRRASRKERNL